MAGVRIGDNPGGADFRTEPKGIPELPASVVFAAAPTVIAGPASYAVLASDQLVEVQTGAVTGGAAQVNLTLPTAASYGIGKVLRIAKTDSDMHPVRVTPTGGDTLGSQVKVYLSRPNQTLTLLAAAGNWTVITTWYGFLDVREFGAMGDGSNADDVPINNATLAGATLGFPVYIPSAPASNATSGVRGWYKMNASLKYYPGSVIFGDGSYSTELRFLNNTHGIEQQSKTTFSTFVRLKGMFLRGMADTSTLPTWTAGLYIGQSQYCRCEDVIIDRFVDGVVLDGTLSLGEWMWRDVYVLTDGYPNFTNRYPRYLCHLMSDGSFKPQAQLFNDMVLYSNPTASTTTGTSNGTNGQTIGPITTSIGLWAESGIKVFAQNATTLLWTQLVSGTDYQVLANSSTGPVITPGSINVGGTRNASPVTSVYVKLLGTQANGVAIQVQYNDPWAKKGLYLENTNAGEAQIFASGCETAVQFSDTGAFTTAFAADHNGNANNNLRISTSYNKGTVSVAFVNPGANNATTTASASGAPNYTVTVTLATDGSGNVIATANQVIDAIRSDPTCYSLLDIRGTTFTTGAGPYPAAVQGQRSDNSGIVAAFASQLLSSANVNVAGPFSVDIPYLQVCDLAVKYGSGFSGQPAQIGTFPPANVAVVVSHDTPNRSSQPVVAPSRLPSDLVAPYDPRLARDSATLTANFVFAVRVVVPKTGVLHDLSLYVSTASGNAIGAVYDTGDTTSGKRTALWSGSSTSLGATNGVWINLGDPNLPVTAGQELDLAFIPDNAVATSLRIAGAAGSDTLPSSFWLVPGGALPKLAWSFNQAAFSIPGTINEASCGSNATPVLLIARVA